VPIQTTPSAAGIILMHDSCSYYSPFSARSAWQQTGLVNNSSRDSADLAHAAIPPDDGWRRAGMSNRRAHGGALR
jgi:hypothetical protein